MFFNEPNNVEQNVSSQAYGTAHSKQPQQILPLTLPLLGPKTYQELLEAIFKAIVDEATAVDFYCRLLKEAPDELHHNFIEHAYKDELEHLQYFIRLYCQLSGREPRYSIKPVRYSCYKEALLIALKDELEAAEYYRDVQLYTEDKLVRDVFYFAMVDELEHATRFSTLYNTCIK